MKKILISASMIVFLVAFLPVHGLAQPTMDFGDAPEGALAYPSLGTNGFFPTCITVGPTTWIQHTNFGGWFGPAVDFEFDGNGGLCPTFGPYDADECFMDGDAGLLFPQAYTIDPSPAVIPCPTGQAQPALGLTCQTAVWGGNVDIDVHNTMPNHPEFVPGYVNVLMDWDQNGMWGGSSPCPPTGTPAPEHVLVNFLVPPLFISPLSALGPPPFLIGPNPGYVWTRFTITEQPVPLPWDGSGGFEDGESEDYLLLIDPDQQPTIFPVLTECPVVDTECPVLHTECPVLVTECPTVATRCPELQTECPVIETECPTGFTFCPAVETECPAVPTHCPGDPTFCPLIDTQCPADPIATICPEAATRCPVVETECPTLITQCPLGIPTWCPIDPTFCPKDPPICPPEEFTIWPEIPTECPIFFTECPQGPTLCPDPPTFCQAADTWCPEIPTQCPLDPVFTFCPVNDTMCPDDPTNCPLNWTFCPNIPTVCPEVQTACPEVITTCPATPTLCETPVPTSCPTDPTNCPVVSTTCPINPTTCPTGPTFCPLIDSDGDGVDDCNDNCIDYPNGPSQGTCTKVVATNWIVRTGQYCTVDGDCLTGEYCEKVQADHYPPGGNGIGDACDCESDFFGDHSVVADDVAAFLAHFGRSILTLHPCTNGDPCYGDFLCDTAVHAGDVAKFLEDFGRNTFLGGNPCPPITGGPWCSYP